MATAACTGPGNHREALTEGALKNERNQHINYVYAHATLILASLLQTYDASVLFVLTLAREKPEQQVFVANCVR